MTRYCAAMFLIAALAAQSRPAAGDPGDVRIAKWPDGKKAAVSLRFDDNMNSHLDEVVPILEKHGIRGTFMVSPGTSRFRRREAEWKEVARAGHELGNHTMHHEGADTPREAEYEIGEAARMLRSYEPKSTGLMLFASGGGKEWGGTSWSDSGREYKDLVEKYSLVDLYDGTHVGTGADGKAKARDLMSVVRKSLAINGRTMIDMHNVGTPTVKDRLRKLVKGKDLSFPLEEFSSLVAQLAGMKDEIWIAPLLETIKYEREYAHAGITVSREGSEVRVALAVGTDPALYDRDLTLAIPLKGSVPRVTQDGNPVKVIRGAKEVLFASVRPFTSTIVVRYEDAASDDPVKK